MLDNGRMAREQDQGLSTGSAGCAKHRKVDSCSLRLGGIVRQRIPWLGTVATTIRLKRTEEFERLLGTKLVEPSDFGSPHLLLARDHRHDRCLDPLVLRGLVRRPRDDFELRSRVHTQKLVLTLPQSDGAQATLSVASKSFFEKDLSEPSYLAEIGLDHLETRRGIDRPKPFE